MTRPPLTDRQQECLVLIQEGVASGDPPSVRELGEAMGIRSLNAVADHVKALERKGYITRTPGQARSARPVDADRWLRLLEATTEQGEPLYACKLCGRRSAEREASCEGTWVGRGMLRGDDRQMTLGCGAGQALKVQP